MARKEIIAKIINLCLEHRGTLIPVADIAKKFELSDKQTREAIFIIAADERFQTRSARFENSNLKHSFGIVLDRQSEEYFKSKLYNVARWPLPKSLIHATND